jgi:two-component system, NarL family, sensor kinase
MSYLLHPPLLDEAGFEAAAHWFIDGFAKRTAMGIKTNFSRPDCHAEKPGKSGRMPEAVELALFRALQEGLMNAHRHSSSPNVEVKYQRTPDLVTLEIQDFGHGLPQAVLERFQRTGTGSGVGLAGIRERVKELGGDFTIFSSSSGTTLLSSVPLSTQTNATESAPVAKAQDISTSAKQSDTLPTNAGGIF